MSLTAENGNFPATATCGHFTVVEQTEGSLRKGADGGLVLLSEYEYLVLAHETDEFPAMGGALVVPAGGTEARLRFRNFVGVTELGGRQLRVESTRITAENFDSMISEVADRLASLPFLHSGQTSQGYTRGRNLSPDALWHAFVCLRDSIAGRTHDLPAAMARIFAKPYETLRPDDPMLVPLERVSAVDPDVVSSIAKSPELLARPVDGSPLLMAPLAERLGGRVPSAVRVRPHAHSTDNHENRFLLNAIKVALDIARQIELLLRQSEVPAEIDNRREAVAITKQLIRWSGHPMFQGLAPFRSLPGSSTVLRGRNGYREVAVFYADLLARTRLDMAADLRGLLESRDAADLYEIWTFFAVLDEISNIKGPPNSLTRFRVDKMGSGVPFRYQAEWGDAKLVYNQTFSRVADKEFAFGKHSYSVVLRPDITLFTDHDGLHLFDAKFKLEILGQTDSEDGILSKFKNEDLHKMHAYRDAIGAQSVWVLYPSAGAPISEYRSPWGGEADKIGFTGVGAIAVRPGACGHQALTDVLERILK